MKFSLLHHLVLVLLLEVEQEHLRPVVLLGSTLGKQLFSVLFIQWQLFFEVPQHVLATLLCKFP